MPDVFLDAGPNSYDLTITTSADWTVSSGGMPNGDNYVTGDGSIAPTYNLNGDDFHIADGTAWSVECWFYYTTATAVVQCIACCGDAGTVTNAWVLNFNASEQITFNIINTSSADYLNCGSATSLATNTWHHVVAVKETGADLKLYIDNVMVSNDLTTTGTARTPTASYRLYVGSYPDGQFDIGASSSGMRIAKLAIYNSALSSTDVDEHYVAMTAA